MSLVVKEHLQLIGQGVELSLSEPGFNSLWHSGPHAGSRVERTLALSILWLDVVKGD